MITAIKALLLISTLSLNNGGGGGGGVIPQPSGSSQTAGTSATAVSSVSGTSSQSDITQLVAYYPDVLNYLLRQTALIWNLTFEEAYMAYKKGEVLFHAYDPSTGWLMISYEGPCVLVLLEQPLY